MKKIVVLMLFVFVVMLTACSSEKVFDFEDGVLVVGMECNYAPFNWTETTRTDTNYPIDGTNMYAEGYDVSIAIRLADELDLELVIKKIDWEGLVPALKSGVIDVIIAGMSPTAERKESISFTDDYYSVEHVVVVRSDSVLTDATVFNDFNGAKIIGQKNTVYDVLANQLATNGGGVYQTPINDVPAIVYGIRTGIYDATILELPVATSVISNNPELTIVSLTESFDLSDEDRLLSIGIRQKDNVLGDRINEFLETISAELRKELMDLAIERSLELI